MWAWAKADGPMMKRNAVMLAIVACLGLGGCPAPRYHYLLRSGGTTEPQKELRGKWEFGAFRISYKLLFLESPELGQDVALAIGIRNRSDSTLYLDWTAARVRCDGGVLSPTKRGFTTTLSPPKTGPVVLSPKNEVWEYIFFNDSSRVLSMSGWTIEAGQIKDGSGVVLHTIPAFAVHPEEGYFK
jgi:hypothetical protein